MAACLRSRFLAMSRSSASRSPSTSLNASAMARCSGRGGICNLNPASVPWLRLTIVGVAIGLAAALMLTHLMGNLLYKVNPRDPIAFGAALIILIAVALIACFLPARRATRIDPVRALRT